MSHPSELLGRARRRRTQPAVPGPAEPRVPAPAPPETPPQSPPPQPERRIAPQPVGGHALYRALMRSHDRMGTRHLDGQG